MTLVVATQNVGRVGFPVAVTKCAEAGAVVIGTSEMADHVTGTPPFGYDWWRPLPQRTYPNGAENPIAYRVDLHIIDRGSRWVHDGLPDSQVPKAAAGTGVHAKRINWVETEDDDGERWLVTMSHTVPSLRYAVMDRLHERHMHVLASMTERHRNDANILHLGDMNCTYAHTNMRRLCNETGLQSNWQHSTHPAGYSFPDHKSRIDHQLYLPSQLTPVRQELVTSPSDHNGLLVEWKVRGT